MIARAFEDISRADIAALIANGVAEGRTLEFKRELPGNGESARKEFLHDVTSFANAQGGDLLYGIDAPKGLATRVVGLSTEDADREILRWEDVLLAGVEPRLPGIRLRCIECGDDGGVLLIRVPASTIAPHRVIFARSNRFYGRKSSGKYEMDTQELRDAFTSSEALPTRLRALHFEAVDAAVRGDLPVGLGNDPTAIVSLVPTTIFREARDLDITPDHALAPHKPSGRIDAVRMIEGVLMHSNPGDNNAARSYSVTHRSGRTDMVWTIGRIVDELCKTEAKRVWPKRFEDGLFDAAISGASRLNQYGIDGPWLVMATLIGIKDYQLVDSNEYWSEPAWRGQATLPPLLMAQSPGRSENGQRLEHNKNKTTAIDCRSILSDSL